jgi:hypothetical protein
VLLALSALLMQADRTSNRQEIIVSTQAPKPTERVRQFIEHLSPASGETNLRRGSPIRSTLAAGVSRRTRGGRRSWTE